MPTEIVNCKKCSGKGQHRQGVCAKCGGSGKVRVKTDNDGSVLSVTQVPK